MVTFSLNRRTSQSTYLESNVENVNIFTLIHCFPKIGCIYPLWYDDSYFKINKLNKHITFKIQVWPSRHFGFHFQKSQATWLLGRDLVSISWKHLEDQVFPIFTSDHGDPKTCFRLATLSFSCPLFSILIYWSSLLHFPKLTIFCHNIWISYSWDSTREDNLRTTASTPLQSAASNQGLEARANTSCWIHTVTNYGKTQPGNKRWGAMQEPKREHMNLQCSPNSLGLSTHCTRTANDYALAIMKLSEKGFSSLT